MNARTALSTCWLSAAIHHAEEVLGPEAPRWLRTPNRALAGKVPLDVAVDNLGAQIVIAELAHLGDASTAVENSNKPVAHAGCGRLL